MSAPRTARERVRAELTSEIKEAARRGLAFAGAQGLSLRAIARELGMASSALYRYFPSRDDLLTAMIVDAYDAVGEATESADAGCPRQDHGRRWYAICRAVRDWALANPHEYALVYGSPVPGYRAPVDTIGPATRAIRVLTTVVNDAARAGRIASRSTGPPLAAAVRADAARVAEALMPDVPEETVIRAMVAWTQLFGGVSFELFGQLEGSVDARDAFFDQCVGLMLDFVGLVGAEPPDGRRRRPRRASERGDRHSVIGQE